MSPTLNMVMRSPSQLRTMRRIDWGRRACPEGWGDPASTQNLRSKFCLRTKYGAKNCLRALPYAPTHKKPHPSFYTTFYRKRRVGSVSYGLCPVETLPTCPIQIHCKGISSGFFAHLREQGPQAILRVVQGTGGVGSCEAMGGRFAGRGEGRTRRSAPTNFIHGQTLAKNLEGSG